jgi:sarcosine/dimethylglycine N-methyltransferase
MENGHLAAVESFYDAHPINEFEILDKLRAKGVDPESATEAEMQEFDQDHYGGVAAVEALAHEAQIGSGQHVLDVCSGMGGPARWLAFRYGCRATGIDLTGSRVEGANRLTRVVGLDSLVRVVQGDATAMPFENETFDAVVSLESWCHIPAKEVLLAECARVMKRGGRIAFSDIVTIGELREADAAKLQAGMSIPRPASAADYIRALESCGFTSVRTTDLSTEWVHILRGRLEMYRSLRDTTAAKLGEQRFQEYDAAYAHFVGLFAAGVLGGSRISASL